MSGFAINQVTLSGNLTRDPELRSTPSGVSVCNLRIANNSRRKDGDEWVDRPNYFDVTIWKGMGEWVAKNLSKGDQVVVSGRMEWREYEKDGQKRQAYDLIADSVVPVPREGGGSNGSDVSADTDGLSTEDARQAAAAAKSDGPDEIPFARPRIPDRETRRRDLFVGDRWSA